MINKNIYNYGKLTPFQWCLMDKFPFLLEEFDALDNWQLFNKLGKKIEEIVVSQNNVGTQTENITNSFNSLVDFINNYFSNLNTQDEINKKLDDMYKDGTLDTLLSRFVTPLFQVQDNKINDIERRVFNLVNIKPKIVDNISEMKDINTIYINKEDNNWYYYKENTWVKGGLYQAIQIDNNSITYNKLSKSLRDNIMNKNIELLDLIEYFEVGNISITSSGWTYSDNSRRLRTKKNLTIPLVAGSSIIIPEGKRMYVGYKKDNQYFLQNWVTDNYIVKNTGDYVLLLSNIGTETDITNISDFIYTFKILLANKTNDKNIINNIKNTFEKDYVTEGIYQHGTLSNTGINYNGKRVYNIEFLKFNDDTNITITSNPDQKIAIKAYKKADYTTYVTNSNTGWIDTPFTISCNKDWYYTIECKYEDDRDITNLLEFSKTIKIDNNNLKKVKDNIDTTVYNKPILVYHRGMISCRPENTLSSFKFCKDLNLKYIECDVHKTLDDIPVIIHDTMLDRLTNGTGTINNITFEDLKKLYIEGTMYIQNYNNKLRIPSFDEFIKYCRDNGMYPFIELKETLEESTIIKIIDILKKYNMIKNCILFSFRLPLIEIVEKYEKNIKVAYMSTVNTDKKINEYKTLKNNKGFIIDYSKIDKRLVDTIHETGGFVGVYTVNNLNDLQKIIDLNVDFIITNNLLYDTNINLEKENLYFNNKGTTFEYTMLENKRRLFDDVFELDIEIYNNSNDCKIKIGSLDYIVPSKDDWQFIKLNYIPVPPLKDMIIKLEGSNCEFLNCRISRYKK